VIEAVGSAVTDRASLPGVNVARLCGVNCHCEPRFHGSALYSRRYVLTGAESHVGLTHAPGSSTCIGRIGIRSALGAARPDRAATFYTASADDVRYLLAKDGDKVGVVLFFDGYSENEKSTFGQIGYLFLDEALGEYAMETRVGFVEFQSRSSQYFERSRPLVELPAQFDHFWGHKEN